MYDDAFIKSEKSERSFLLEAHPFAIKDIGRAWAVAQFIFEQTSAGLTTWPRDYDKPWYVSAAYAFLGIISLPAACAPLNNDIYAYYKGCPSCPGEICYDIIDGDNGNLIKSGICGCPPFLNINEEVKGSLMCHCDSDEHTDDLYKDCQSRWVRDCAYDWSNY